MSVVYQNWWKNDYFSFIHVKNKNNSIICDEKFGEKKNCVKVHLKKLFNKGMSTLFPYYGTTKYIMQGEMFGIYESVGTWVWKKQIHVRDMDTFLNKKQNGISKIWIWK